MCAYESHRPLETYVITLSTRRKNAYGSSGLMVTQVLDDSKVEVIIFYFWGARAARLYAQAGPAERHDLLGKVIDERC